MKQAETPETVLVTGAGGRIGRRLVPLLLQNGYRVRALQHRAPVAVGQTGRIELVTGDILDQQSMKKVAQGCSFIVHLAAAWDMFPPAVHERENNQLFDSIIRGTYNLLEAAREQPQLRALLFASTDAVYATGIRPFSAPITEGTSLVPSRFYAAAKIMCESMCALYSSLYGTPWIVLRICWCLEPEELLRLFSYEFWKEGLSNEDRNRVRRLSRGKGLFAPLNADGSSAVDHVSHPSDISRGIQQALSSYEAALGGTFNLAGPKPFRYLDVVPWLAERTGVRWDSAVVKGISPYELRTDRAEKAFGYRPSMDAERMIIEALERSRT